MNSIAYGTSTPSKSGKTALDVIANRIYLVTRKAPHLQHCHCISSSAGFSDRVTPASKSMHWHGLSKFKLERLSHYILGIHWCFKFFKHGSAQGVKCLDEGYSRNSSWLCHGDQRVENKTTKSNQGSINRKVWNELIDIQASSDLWRQKHSQAEGSLKHSLFFIWLMWWQLLQSRTISTTAKTIFAKKTQFTNPNHNCHNSNHKCRNFLATDLWHF